MWVCPNNKEHFEFVRNGLFHLVVGPDSEEIFVCPPTYADRNDYTGAYCHTCGAEAEETCWPSNMGGSFHIVRYSRPRMEVEVLETEEAITGLFDILPELDDTPGHYIVPDAESMEKLCADAGVNPATLALARALARYYPDEEIT